MPFDVQDFPGASRRDRAATRQSRRLVATWLFTVAAMIMVMVVLGGVTRLTGSGLSIMEWAPLMGALPPTSDAEWQRLFALYQKIPQYTLVNEGFGLAGFKHIFWLEWTHRLWGRLIGVVFLLPMLWLWVHRADRAPAGPAPRPAVRPRRPARRRSAGSWSPPAFCPTPPLSRRTAWSSISRWPWCCMPRSSGPGFRRCTRSATAPPVPPALRRLAFTCLAMVSLTIVAGGFTAGLHAGLTYNTFPLMDGRLVPEGYAMLHPFLRNLTENIAAVQFDHRLLATITLILVSLLAAFAWRSGLPRPLAVCLAAAVAGQYLLGVTTLLLVVPVPVAAMHQSGAVLLLTAVLIVVHRLSGAPNRPIERPGPVEYR